MTSDGKVTRVKKIETKAYRQAPLWATQAKGEKMTSMFTYVESENSAKIKVIGVGGAGGNAINNMIASNLQGVKFISANTDAQALDVSQAEMRMQLGTQITEGLGAGANPQVGRDAALENAEMIKEALTDSHMVFITAGFGGGDLQSGRRQARVSQEHFDVGDPGRL